MKRLSEMAEQDRADASGDPRRLARRVRDLEAAARALIGAKTRVEEFRARAILAEMVRER